MTPSKPFLRCLVFSLLLLVSLANTACDGGNGSGQGFPDEGLPATSTQPAGYSIVEGCAETFCDAKREQTNAQCEQCTHSCIGSPSCDYSSCASFCGSTPCTTGDDACKRTGLVVRLGATDDDVRRACQNYYGRQKVCHGGKSQLQLCDAFARVERPEVTEWYRCLTKLPCEATKEEQDVCVEGDRHPLGAIVCDALDRRGGGRRCVANERKLLDHAGEWLRDDVREAGLGCVELEDDQAVSECFGLWWATLGI